MKKIYLFLVLIMVVSACDEGGLVITVPSTGAYQFNVKKTETNDNPDHSFTVKKPIDPTVLFNEDKELIRSVALDLLTYEVSQYSGTAGNDVHVDLTLKTELGGNSNEILFVDNILLKNGLMTAFQEGKPTSQMGAAQVASLEAIIDNQEIFDLVLIVKFDSDIESDFSVNIVWDLTATVSQESN